MRILVIGGTGFIGPAVVCLLHEQRHDITLFHRGQAEVDLPSAVQHIHCGNARILLRRLIPSNLIMRQKTSSYAQ